MTARPFARFTTWALLAGGLGGLLWAQTVATPFVTFVTVGDVRPLAVVLVAAGSLCVGLWRASTSTLLVWYPATLLLAVWTLGEHASSQVGWLRWLPWQGTLLAYLAAASAWLLRRDAAPVLEHAPTPADDASDGRGGRAFRVAWVSTAYLGSAFAAWVASPDAHVAARGDAATALAVVTVTFAATIGAYALGIAPMLEARSRARRRAAAPIRARLVGALSVGVVVVLLAALGAFVAWVLP